MAIQLENHSIKLVIRIRSHGDAGSAQLDCNAHPQNLRHQLQQRRMGNGQARQIVDLDLVTLAKVNPQVPQSFRKVGKSDLAHVYD